MTADILRFDEGLSGGVFEEHFTRDWSLEYRLAT
jgi:hypothetical protein